MTKFFKQLGIALLSAIIFFVLAFSIYSLAQGRSDVFSHLDVTSYGYGTGIGVLLSVGIFIVLLAIVLWRRYRWNNPKR